MKWCNKIAFAYLFDNPQHVFSSSYFWWAWIKIIKWTKKIDESLKNKSMLLMWTSYETLNKLWCLRFLLLNLWTNFFSSAKSTNFRFLVSNWEVCKPPLLFRKIFAKRFNLYVYENYTYKFVSNESCGQFGI